MLTQAKRPVTPSARANIAALHAAHISATHNLSQCCQALRIANKSLACKSLAMTQLNAARKDYLQAKLALKAALAKHAVSTAILIQEEATRNTELATIPNMQAWKIARLLRVDLCKQYNCV